MQPHPATGFPPGASVDLWALFGRLVPTPTPAPGSLLPAEPPVDKASYSNAPCDEGRGIYSQVRNLGIQDVEPCAQGDGKNPEIEGAPLCFSPGGGGAIRSPGVGTTARPGRLGGPPWWWGSVPRWWPCWLCLAGLRPACSEGWRLAGATVLDVGTLGGGQSCAVHSTVNRQAWPAETASSLSP